MKRFTDGMTPEQIAYFHKHKRRYFDSRALFYARIYHTLSRSESVIGDPVEYLAWLFLHHPDEWLKMVMFPEGGLGVTLAHLNDVMEDMVKYVLPEQEKS